MANISHDDMAKRVASRFIRAQEQQQQQGQQQQESQQQQQALPQSGPGKGAVKSALDKVMGAFDGGDEATFHKELDNLISLSKHPGA